MTKVPDKVKFKLSVWQIAISLMFLLYGIILYRNAWVGDDAYITFRTVDNFINGYGLTWNVAERVQAYTNALWMFVISFFYWITHEVFYTSIIVSMVISLLTVALVAWRTAATKYIACLAIVALVLSKVFVDYSTSGLENPLSHLLAVLFFLVFIRRPAGAKTTLLLSLVAALAAVNRPDTLLVYLPVLVYSVWQNHTWENLLYAVAGFTPLILWELFSLFYYGFLFPNTAYAKLGTCVSWTKLAEQGIYYFWNSLQYDPLTIPVILCGLIVPVITRKWRLALLSCGMLLYLLYVIKIGGSFMSGRYFALPYLIAVIILARFGPIRPAWTRWVIAGVVIVIGLSNPLSPLYTTAAYSAAADEVANNHGIVDERGWYFQSSSLLNISDDEPMPAHIYARVARSQHRKVVDRGTIGYYGYFARPETYIVDIDGLADPLLARLPCDVSQQWRIGHVPHTIPDGYNESVYTGQNKIKNSDLAVYYEKLSLIIRGDLFDRARLETIIKFDLGEYDHYLVSYVAAQE